MCYIYPTATGSIYRTTLLPEGEILHGHFHSYENVKYFFSIALSPYHRTGRHKIAHATQ